MSTGSITTSGLGSGIDIEDILSKMKAAEQRPVTFLNAKKTIYKGQISAYDVVRESISSFDLALGGLLDPGKYGAIKGTSSNTSVATMFAGKSADPGTYKLDVTKLAEAQKVVSAKSYDATTALGTGKLTINLGKYDSGTDTFTSSKSVDINITSSNNTLGSIRDSINAADTGVTATIINDGTGSRLVLTSKETGEETAFEVVVDPASTGDLADFAYSPVTTAPNAQMTLMQAAQNAEFKIDGIAMTSTSNEVGGYIKGLSFSLKGVGKSDIVVERSTADLKKAITTFVESYNELQNVYKEATKFVKGGGDDGQDLMGPLNGDSTIRSFMDQLRRVMGGSVKNVPGSVTNLAQIGINFQKDGTLSLDGDKLDKVLADPNSNIEAMFRSTGKPSTKGVTFISATSTVKEGEYGYKLERDSTGKITGTINGMAVTVNGNQVTAGGISLLFEEGLNSLEGKLYYTDGLAGKMRATVDGATNSQKGSLFKRVESLNKMIDDVDTRVSTINTRVETRMLRMRDQLNKMDSFMAQMDSMSKFLTQQFAAMSGSSKK